MKKAYSEYRPIGTLDKIIAELEFYSQEDSKEKIREYLTKESGFISEYDLNSHIVAERMSHHLDYLYLTKSCVHYFFAGTGFMDWLKEAAPKTVSEQVDIMIDYTMDAPIVLHYENGTSPCYLINAFETVLPSQKNKKFVFCNYKDFCFNFSDSTEPNHETQQHKNLICASIAYIQAFPEMIKPGIPDDLRHPNHYRKTISKTVGMSSQIIERDGPTPHFRVGHFRHLISERFKHKRGQTIFVRGTFVKGKAETVLSPDGNAQ